MFSWLQNDLLPPYVQTEAEYQTFMKEALNFFIRQGQLWKKHADEQHQLVIEKVDQFELICRAHCNTHYGDFNNTYAVLTKHAWWPMIAFDLNWVLMKCQAFDCTHSKRRCSPVPCKVFVNATDLIHGAENIEKG